MWFPHIHKICMHTSKQNIDGYIICKLSKTTYCKLIVIRTEEHIPQHVKGLLLCTVNISVISSLLQFFTEEN